MIGQTISHYRIIEKLGGGGMGVVYKAEDIKLNPFVPLKFLQDAEATGPEAPLRVQGVVKAVGALNHRPTGPLREISEGGGRRCGGVGFMEARPLSPPIRGKPLPLEQ